MFSGTGSIIQNIPVLNINDGIFYKLLSVPDNIVMNLNNDMLVMKLHVSLLHEHVNHMLHIKFQR
jgi:hypothetical protein